MQASPTGAVPPFMSPGDFVPVLSSMAGVASPVCISGMMTRGGVAAPLVAGHALSGLAERGLAARCVNSLVSTDGAPSAAGTTAHQVFNLGKLSAQLGVSEHGELMLCAVMYSLFTLYLYIYITENLLLLVSLKNSIILI